MGGPRESTVGHEPDGCAEARTLQGPGDMQHLAHARAALRALVSNDNEVARLDLAALDSHERLFLAVEYTRSPAED
jgi:hypothetical protein